MYASYRKRGRIRLQGGGNRLADRRSRRGAAEIGRADTGGKRRFGGALQPGRFGMRAEVAEHEGGGEQGRGRVGDATPGDVRRTAVDRLEQALCRSPTFAEAATPSPPMCAAARSERMSPKRFVVTSTSNASGACDEPERGGVHEQFIKRDVRDIPPRLRVRRGGTGRRSAAGHSPCGRRCSGRAARARGGRRYARRGGRPRR